MSLPSNITSAVSSILCYPNSLVADNWAWRFNLNGTFDLKSAYNLAIQVNSPNSQRHIVSCKWMWKAPCHIRNFFFLWKLFSKALPTNDLLSSRGIPISAMCPLCGMYPESATHIFKDFSMMFWV